MTARLLVARLLSWLTIRNAPAAFRFVLNPNDSGPGSLRQTIQDAAAGIRSVSRSVRQIQDIA